MNFSEFQQVLLSYKTSSAYEILSIILSIIDDESLFTSFDKFEVNEDEHGRLLSVKVVFNDLLSVRAIACLSRLPKFFTLDSVGNNFSL